MEAANQPEPGGNEGSHLDRVVSGLRPAVVHGRLAPGARISGDEVAERLGVNRKAVTERFWKLDAEGLLRLGETQNAARGSPLTERDARRLFAMLGGVEGLSAMWAAEPPKKRRDQLLKSLRKRYAATRNIIT